MKEKKGELTRQHIIAKAAPIFNQRGFAGCSMQDLMQATGLEKGGIYRHFASKEDLAAESFKYALQQVTEARVGAPDQQLQGALPRLRHIVQAFVQTPSPIPGGCPLMNAASELESSSELRRALANEAISRWRSRLCRILRQGIRHHEIRVDVQPRRTANAIISMLEGALMISRLEGSKDAMIDAQNSLETLFTALTP